MLHVLRARFGIRPGVPTDDGYARPLEKHVTARIAMHGPDVPAHDDYAELLEKDVTARIAMRGLPKLGISVRKSGDRGITIKVLRRTGGPLEIVDERRPWGSDRVADTDAVLDHLNHELRRSVGLRELVGRNVRPIRRKDGSTRLVELVETPPYMNSGHPAVVTLARMIGIGAEHLAHPTSEYDAQGAVVHTTPWPERRYWRVTREPVDGIRIHHTLTIGKAALGLRSVSSGKKGVTIDIAVEGQLPETMLVAIQAGGLTALIEGFLLPTGSSEGNAITDISLMPPSLWRDNATVYRVKVEDAPYVPLETPPEGMDMSWMDADWNWKKG